jgi:polyphenol oxidase
MSWVWRQGKNLTYLTIPEWEAEGIQLGFSTRWGGVSKPPYSSLNLGFHVGDSAEDVRVNREIWFKEWDASWSEVAIGEQVHGTKTCQVNLADAGRGSQSLSTVLPKVDALVTTSAVGLMAFFADCVPVFFFHPKIRAVGIAHAGWKGTAGKIVQNTLEQIRINGGDPADCWVALGPSIGPCCYEVDERVIKGFEESFIEPSFLKPGKPGHAQLDLWHANQVALIEAGVCPEKIWVSRICTACHTDSFFSHRIEGPETGRMAGWIRQTSKRED